MDRLLRLIVLESFLVQDFYNVTKWKNINGKNNLKIVDVYGDYEFYFVIYKNDSSIAEKMLQVFFLV